MIDNRTLSQNLRDYLKMFAGQLDGETIAQIGKLIEKLELLQSQQSQLSREERLAYARKTSAPSTAENLTISPNTAFADAVEIAKRKTVEENQTAVLQDPKALIKLFPGIPFEEVTPPIPQVGSIHLDSGDN